VTDQRHCCERMMYELSKIQMCDMHTDPFDCPDSLINYWQKYNEYGIIIHDGGSSQIHIHYCPWCGSKLPESKRDEILDDF
jgi:hypothetical protein